MVSLKKSLGLAMTALLAQQAYSQDFAESMQSMGKNAVEGYMQPFATGIGVGMNSQWAYSAKTMSFLGLPVGFNLYFGYPLVFVNDDMKTFNFHGEIPVASILDQATPSGMNIEEMTTILEEATGNTYDLNEPIEVNVKNAPTIYGSNKAQTRTMEELVGNSDAYLFLEDWNTYATGFNDSLESVDGPDSLMLDTIDLSKRIALPFRGFGIPIAPSLPPVGANLAISRIPVLNNITLGLRFVPTRGNDELGEVGMFGFMVQHEITPHIPVFSKVPFVHMGAYYGYNSFFIEAKDIARVESKNHIGMFLVSLDAKFLIGLGVYGGIGFEKSTFSVDIEEFEIEGLEPIPGFSMEIEGENTLRTQLGARISLAVFDIYTDANWGSTTTYNIGVAIGLNGL